MIEVPSDISKFDLFKFQKPNSFYWPGYMWIWNDALTQSDLDSQLNDMAEQQARSPMPVPEPKTFRPRNQPTRLEPEYLSPSYLDLYQKMVIKAESLNMHVWLYDEGGWPSGSVCGELTKKYPNLTSQTLQVKKGKIRKDRKFKIPKDCICAVIMQDGKAIQVLEPNDLNPLNWLNNPTSINISNAEIWIFYTKSQGRYPDLLNPLTTTRFIEMTHEKYASVIGDYFGKNVCLTFTDEPKIQKPVWTDDLLQDFKDKKGYDLRPFLPALFTINNDSDKQIRIDFYDWWSNRFAMNYFGQIQEWCHNHNLLSGGHLNGEDETLGAINGGFGHVLRPLRKMDVPGIDTIWRQIWPGRFNHHFPKYASTAAHQENHPWVLSESFAVYGSGISTPQMKWIVNYQLVRGINLFDIATYQYSNKDWFIGGERPVFGPTNPLWKYMHLFHEYIARLSYVLSLGHPLITVGVYYPVCDLWAGGDDAKSAALANDTLVNFLQDHQIDFHFIDDDVIVGGSKIETLSCLSNPNKSIVSLVVGPMQYTSLYISHTKWIPPKSKAKLLEFEKAGGRIYWIEREINGEKDNSEVSQIQIESNNPLVMIEPPTSKIRVCVRQTEQGRIYFLVNEDIKPIFHSIRFREPTVPRILDPERGTVYEPSNMTHSELGWTVDLDFQFSGSYLISFLDDSLAQDVHKGSIEPIKHVINKREELYNLSTNWNGRKVRSFKIKRKGIETNINKLDLLKPIQLGLWNKWAGRGFSGDIEYVNQFDCNKELIEKASELDLGNVLYVCEVIINGENLGKRIWPPYTFNIQGKLRIGKNDLRIIVTNTLANQYITTKFFTKWSKMKLGPYHPKAMKFERDSLPSGLLGPVIIQ